MGCPIKLRVYDTRLNRFINLVNLFLIDGSISDSNGEYIIQQGTGVTDNEQKEIYEGDIVKMDGRYKDVGEIVFHNGGFSMVQKNALPFDLQFAEHSNINYLKIIGNIFDTKFKKEKKIVLKRGLNKSENIL